MREWLYLAVVPVFVFSLACFYRLLQRDLVLSVVPAGVTTWVVYYLIHNFYARSLGYVQSRKQGGTGQMKTLFIRFARFTVLIFVGLALLNMTLLMLYDSGIDQGLLFIIAPVPFIIVGVILMKFGDILKQPPKLTVIRIESFPKSNGPQIAGVISRHTGIDGVDDLLKKLPVEFEVEAETSEDLKSPLVQLGCN
jgi:hypothetical protein